MYQNFVHDILRIASAEMPNNNGVVSSVVNAGSYSSGYFVLDTSDVASSNIMLYELRPDVDTLFTMECSFTNWNYDSKMYLSIMELPSLPIVGDSLPVPVGLGTFIPISINSQFDLVFHGTAKASVNIPRRTISDGNILVAALVIDSNSTDVPTITINSRCHYEEITTYQPAK